MENERCRRTIIRILFLNREEDPIGSMSKEGDAR